MTSSLHLKKQPLLSKNKDIFYKTNGGEGISPANSDMFDKKTSCGSTEVEDSSSVAAADYDHYTRNQIKIKQVQYDVPYPQKCPECDYDGFTQLEYRHNCSSFCLTLPLIGCFSLCWLFGTCKQTRHTCFNDYKNINHKCFQCKTVLAQKKRRLIGKRT